MRREARKRIKKYKNVMSLLNYIGIPVSALIVVLSFTLFSVSNLLGFLVMGAGFLTMIGVITASVLLDGKTEEIANEEYFHKVEKRKELKQQALSEENVIIEDFVNERENIGDGQKVADSTAEQNDTNRQDNESNFEL